MEIAPDVEAGREVTSLSLSGVSRADGAWRLQFEPDAVSLECTDGTSAGRHLVISRDQFFRELEYREWLGLLVILRPKRLGLRLSADDQKRLRRWLGPPGTAEIEHVVGVRLAGALFGYLALAALALFYNPNDVYLVLAIMGVINAAAARFRARTSHLLVQACITSAMGLYAAWQLLSGQVHYASLSVVLLVIFLVSASSAWRVYRLLTAGHHGSC